MSWVGQSPLRGWSIPAGDTLFSVRNKLCSQFCGVQSPRHLGNGNAEVSGNGGGKPPLQGGRGLRPWCPPWKGQLLPASPAAILEPATGRGRVCTPPRRAHPCSALGMGARLALMGAGPTGCSELVAHLRVIGSFFFFFTRLYFTAVVGSKQN